MCFSIDLKEFNIRLFWVSFIWNLMKRFKVKIVIYHFTMLIDF